MSDNAPTIEKTLEVQEGYIGFLIPLYFWSDGVVTWKKER